MEFLSEHPVLAVLFVFVARVLDVSIGTVRTIFVFRGYRGRASMLGFVESLTWITAAGVVLANLTAWYMLVAYAAGYATGNWVGIWLEAKLAMGLELVRVLSKAPEVELAARLREGHFSVVALDGNDDEGSTVEVLFVVTERRRLPQLIDRITVTDPTAIYTISDVKLHRSSSAATAQRRRLLPLRK